MTKSELITVLEGKFYKVLTDEHNFKLIGDDEGIKYYHIAVYDKSGDKMNKIVLHFYVEKEGDDDEAAYWDQSEPKTTPPTPPVTFASELATYIANKIGDGTIEGAVIESLSEANETAVASAYLIADGELVSKRLFIDKDAGNIRHRVFTGVI